MPPWVFAMDWRDALFLHWPVPAETLRAVIPRDLELDVLDGSAWVGIVAFRITAARPRGVPAAAGARSFGEINVRTYVNGDKPGVWFLSLDAASDIAVWAGRGAIHLPYYRARIATAWDTASCAFTSQRTDARGPDARFDARATFAGDARPARTGTLEHALMERYCFYTADRRGRTVRGDVAHAPWPIAAADATIAANTLLSAANITPATAAPANGTPANVMPAHVVPLAHASRGVATRAWPLQRVASVSV